MRGSRVQGLAWADKPTTNNPITTNSYDDIEYDPRLLSKFCGWINPAREASRLVAWLHQPAIFIVRSYLAWWLFDAIALAGYRSEHQIPNVYGKIVSQCCS
jgi:hypothetical protein